MYDFQQKPLSLDKSQGVVLRKLILNALKGALLRKLIPDNASQP